MKKFCISLTEHAADAINFERNVTVNKKRTKIAPRCKSMLHL